MKERLEVEMSASRAAMLIMAGASSAPRVGTNEGLAAAVEQMKSAGTAAVKDIENLTLSLGNLRNEIDLLKKETSVPKTVSFTKL